MPVFASISTQTRSRIRAAEDEHHKDEDYIQLAKEAQRSREIARREKELTPEELAAYNDEIDKIKKMAPPEGIAQWSAKHWDFISKEIDYVIGKYLGKDMRRFPEYIPDGKEKLPEETPERFLVNKSIISDDSLDEDERLEKLYKLTENREKREKLLTDLQREAYKKELEELDKLEPPEGVIRWSAAHRKFMNQEKDVIIGKYLGEDMREYPHYVSHKEEVQKSINRNNEIEKRISMLSEEQQKQYRDEKEMVKIYDPPEGIIRRSYEWFMYIEHEEDVIDGKYLGEDIRKYPNYVSRLVIPNNIEGINRSM